jgi:RNA polymerase sigma-70 factor, ECF subfamily
MLRLGRERLRRLRRVECSRDAADTTAVTTPDFDEVLAGAVSGDSAAFTTLWRDHQPMLLRYLRVLAGDQADDIAAETWIDVVRRLGSFRGDDAGFRGWLVTIARHKVIDQRRRENRRRERLVADYTGIEPTTAHDGERDVLERLSTEGALRLIATLPADVAEMVSLRVIVGLDVAEVARIVGRRPGTVRVAVHRGLQRLAAQLLTGDVTPGQPPALLGRDD